MQNKTDQKNSLSQFIFSDNGELQLRVPKDGVPEFFVEVGGYVNTGQTKKAAKLLKNHADKALAQALKNDPSKESLMYLLLALMFQRTGQVQKAEEWYKKILELETNALVFNEL